MTKSTAFRLIMAAAVSLMAVGGVAHAQSWPEQGKTLTVIVPWSTGGGNMRLAQQTAPFLSQELGIPVNVEPIDGAASQIGITQFISRPADGYTIAAVTLPGIPLVYLDPDRQAAYKRDNFIPLGLQTRDSIMVAVAKDSPYQTLEDLLKAAKERPGELTLSGAGVGGIAQYTLFDLQRKAGVKFRWVANEGQQDGLFNLLGGHVDGVVDNAVGGFLSGFQSGDIRILATSFQDDVNLPGVPTFKSLGYDVEWAAVRGLMVLKDTPQEAVDALEKALVNVQNNEEFKTTLTSGGSAWIPLMDMAESTAYWDQVDANLTALIPEVKATQ